MTRLAILGAGALGWLAFLFMTGYALTEGWRLTTGNVWQVDWHVYVAGAHQLLDRELYEQPLSLGGLPLSATEFKLPPLSAVWPIPLLPLPIEAGGIVWQVVAAASVATAAVLATMLVELRRPVAWAGIALGVAAFTLLYLEGLHLATNNYLVLGLVAGSAWLYLRGSDRGAGVLLGLAIATKVWPAALLVPAARERRWTILLWAAGVLAVQGLAFLAWQGLDLPADLLRTMRAEIPPTGYLIGPTAIEWARPIWNSGVSVVVAALLLLVHARGRLAIGLAILAGLAPLGNLWLHYAPTVMFAVALMLPSFWRLLPRRSTAVEQPGPAGP